MMRRVVLLVLLGLVAYVGALAATLPARHALAWAEPYLAGSGADLQLAGIEGSVWRGRAAYALAAGVEARDLRWRFVPTSLFGARAAVDFELRLPDGHLAGRARVRPDGSTELVRTTGRVPADWVAGRVPALPVALGGILALNLEHLGWEDSVPSASGTVVWNSAALVAPQAIPLGDLKAQLAPAEGGGVRAELSDAGGPLDLQGELTLEPGGVYRLDASLASRGSAELSQALAVLGKRGPDGRVRLRLSGRL